MKTPEEIAAELTARPYIGSHLHVDDVRAVIAESIRADRAQRTPATSASDRYERARKVLAQYDEHTEPRSISDQRRREYRLASALRALIEPAPIEGPNGAETERVYTEAYEREKRTGAGEMWASAAGRRAIYDLGVQHSWEQWESENAPGMVDTRATDVIDIVFDRLPDHEGANFIEAEDAHGRGVKVGEWVARSDGSAALRIEVVR